MSRRVDLDRHQAALDAMPGRRRPPQPIPGCACALTGVTCSEAPRRV